MKEGEAILKVKYNYEQSSITVHSKKPSNEMGIPVISNTSNENIDLNTSEQTIIFKMPKAEFKRSPVFLNISFFDSIPILAYENLNESNFSKLAKASFIVLNIVDKPSLNDEVEIKNDKRKTITFSSVNVDFKQYNQVPYVSLIREIPITENIRINSKHIPVAFKLPPIAVLEAISDEIPSNILQNVKSMRSDLQVNSIASSKSNEQTNIAEEELIDINGLEQLYDKLNIGKLASTFLDRPYIIIASKHKNFEYIEFLKRVLREIYRVRAEGLPEPKHVSVKRDLYQLLPFSVEARGKIFVIDLTQRLNEEIDQEIIREINDRLREIYSQSFGFIVFYLNYGSLQKFYNEGQNIFGENKNFQEPITFNIMNPKPLILFTNLMWGVIKSDENKEIKSFDNYVVSMEDNYWNKLQSLLKEFDLIAKVKPNSTPDEKDKESATHYLVKAFVTKFLINKIKEELKDRAEEDIANCINTEQTLDNNRRLDIYVGQCGSSYDNLIVEIETLYGTGTIIHKLLDTIKTRLNDGNRLWIVIPNPQAIIYLPLLLKTRNYAKKLYNSKEIEFYTLDIENNSLIDLVTIKRKIDEIIKS